MIGFLRHSAKCLFALSLFFVSLVVPLSAGATPFTTTVPGVGIPLPSAYPEAGGVAIVLVGDNGNIYYQFSDPSGAFVGFQNSGSPAAFRGNPFTINDPIPLDCGIRSCTDYFGGGIAQMYVRFSAYDGDTQVGGFDYNDIDLVMNGVSVGNWSSVTTQKTNNSGTQSYGSVTGFGNNTFNTGWFSTSNQTLLDNILTTGQTTTQVYDSDPNDNYWDFRRGPSLGNEDLRTVAPGYELVKVADRASFAAVGEVVTYTYTVTNIGSVNINNLTLTDDKISNVTCDTNSIAETTGGGSAEYATCTGTYTITQEDFDAQEVTNIAQANGDPEYGSLGAVTDTVTLPGPSILFPELTLTKEANVAAFTTPGQVVTYTYTIENTGDSTVSDIDLTDSKIPGILCNEPSLAPSENTICTATYTVTQDDIDAFAINGTQLSNVASADGSDPNGGPVQATAQVDLDGPTAAPAMSVDKTAAETSYESVGDVLNFIIAVTNTGNVTWPNAPSIQDDLVTGAGGSVACPSGTVLPGDVVTCTASYTIQQPDLDDEEITNTATASITVAGVPAQADGSVTVPAVVTSALDILKQLPSGAPTEITSLGQQISYEYVLTNSGTVTLNTPTVTDDKVTVACTETTIAPGTSITCTSSAPHTVTQPDLDAGSVTNLATASAVTVAGNTVSSPQTSLTVPVTAMPAMTLVKTAPTVAPADFAPGYVVTYSYDVTNSGNVTITAPITVTDDQIAGAIDCGTAPLAPGDSRTCTADYTVLATDVAAGSVTNRATATDGTTTSNEDTATIPQEGSPALTLVKTAVTADFVNTSDTIDYTFTITNSGDTVITSLTPITVDDPKISSVDCATNLPATLAPGASFDCTGTYGPVTQAEIDAGEVVNSASASFNGPNGLVTSNVASETVSSAVVPGLSLDKVGPSNFGAVGSTVTYTFNVTNDSAQTIATASVTDPMIPGLNCDFTDIAPFATVNCTGNYIVQQADLDLGSIENTATASGTAPTGETLGATDTETTPADPAAQIYSLDLTKTAQETGYAAVGDTLDYSFTVMNTGTVTLTNVTVADVDLGMSCDIATIAPGGSDTSCTGSRLVTQADIDAGSYTNTATATGPGGASDTGSATVPGPTRNADFTVDKTTLASDVVEGEVIVYNYEITNTGNVTLTGITLSDAHTSASGLSNLTFSPSNVVTSLEPGQTATLTAPYTVTQEDVDAGAPLTNVVTADATPPAGVTPPTATDSASVDVVAAAPAFSVVKSEQDANGSFVAPTTPAILETFTFEVTNDGNVTLTGLTLTDPLTGFSCILPDFAPGATVTQCENTTPLSTTYEATQADVDAGSLTNTVEVTDGTVTETGSVTLSGPTQAPAIDMTKAATSGATYTSVGELVDYSYEITNTGNITLTGSFDVSDDKVTVSCPVTPAAGIPPLGTITCTAQHVVTQTDLDTGSITNTATASIVQSVIPGGPTVVSSGPASETVTAGQSPSLTIDKMITPATSTTFSASGDTISYDYVVTNDGNVTIPAPITVDDDQIGLGLTCLTADIAPGDSATCTHVWTADQPSVDAGSITNTASPVATFGGTAVPADSDSVTAPAIQAPDMTLTKSYVSITNNSYAAGETITYRYTVENTGNTTITTEPTITDNLIPNAANITIDAPFPAAGMLPGDVITYTGTYLITLSDVQLGSITNTATAESNGVISNPSSVTTPEGFAPALSISKSADTALFDETTGTITYTYEVENTSVGVPAPAFANQIEIIDDKITSPILCDMTADGQLVVGEKTTCTATYSVTQDDLDAGEVTNSAVAATTFGTSDVFSPVAVLTVDGDEKPDITIGKSVIAGANPAEAGDVLTYEITVENSGNQTLQSVDVSDPLIPTLTCERAAIPTTPPVSDFVPGEVLTCTGDYTVTQDNIDTQLIENTASTSAINPQGVDVSDSTTLTHPPSAPAPAMQVEKTYLGANDFSAVGEALTYRVSVTNIGNVTLNTVDVTDSLVSGTCTIGPLAPLDSDESCEFTYIVTQADIDAGQVDNTVTASALPANPGATPFSETGSETVNGPLPEPSWSITKTPVETSFSLAGDVLTYDFVVANTGNVTLFGQPSITDDKIGTFTCGTIDVVGLPPGESLTCSATYTVIQDDLDAGEVVNIASVSSTDAPFDPQNPGSQQTDATVNADQQPSISVKKSSDLTSNVQVGETITYSFEVENTGNVRLFNIALTDDHTDATGTGALPISSGGTIAQLEPGEIVTLTASYVVQQADIDAGIDLLDTVSVTSDSPDGTKPAASDDLSVDLDDIVPSLDVIKTLPGSYTGSVDEELVYVITVENTGNATIQSVTLSDDISRLNGDPITPDPTASLTNGDGVDLSPGEVWTYEVRHTVTQEDVDAGGLSNTATANGSTVLGDPVNDVSGPTTGTDTPTDFPITAAPKLETLKTVTVANVTLGQSVTFEITVKNTGNVTLNSVTVMETPEDYLGAALTPSSGPSFVSADMGSSEGALKPGETATYEVSFVLTQPIIDAGGIVNTASASGTPPIGSPVTDATDTPADHPIPANPSISLDKRLQTGSGPTYNAVDQELVYEFAVTNSGNVTITDQIIIYDPLITDAGQTITCAAPPYAPGSETVCTGSYFVTQDDLDTGNIPNAAKAAAGSLGPAVDEFDVQADQTPALSMTKLADPILPEDYILGATIDYTYTVTNSGNVTLVDAITVSDDKIASITCDPLPSGGLAPTKSVTCTGTYTLTAADIQLTSVTNLATATSGDVDSPEVSETVTNQGVPSLALDKTLVSVTDAADSPRASGNFAAEGDKLTYEFTVTNDGSMSFANPVTINDDLIAGPITCYTPDATNPDLTPNEQVTCQAVYVVTQEDVDLGSVTNTASAETSYGPGSTQVVSPDATEEALADTTPELTLVKTVDPTSYTAVGDVLTYTINVTNSGNQTLDNVDVTDTLLPSLSCSFASLAPGAQETCSATLTIDQPEIDAGQVVNIADGAAEDPTGAPIEGTSNEVTATGPTDPGGLTLVKTATPTPFGAVGSTITYGFEVTNDGPYTLSDIEVTDPIDTSFSCTIATIAPGDSDSSCSLDYTVSQDDVDNGEIVNAASATGADPFDRPVSNTDEITTPGPEPLPSLEAIKTATVGGTDVGDTITYTLVVTNTGNVTLSDLVIDDDMTRIANGDATALTMPFALTSGDLDSDSQLDVDEVWTYSASYTLTQADLNGAGVQNSATVTAQDPNETEVFDVSDEGDSQNGDDNPTIVPIEQLPGLAVVKSVSTSGNEVDDMIVFRIEATNTGNVDLSTFTVGDDLTRLDGTDLSANIVGPTRVDPGAADTILSPGGVWAWEVTYTLTQPDIDAGGISNIATVDAQGPQGDPIEAVSSDDDPNDGNPTVDPTELVIPPTPELDVTKTLTSAVPTMAGDVVTFEISALNTGNVTIQNADVVDTLLRADSTPLTPDSVTPQAGFTGDIDVGMSAVWIVTYTLQQDDIDAGGIENSAIVSGESPAGVPVADVSDNGDDTDGNSTDDPTVVPIIADNTLNVTKTAGIPARIAGTLFRVTFTISVENAGNVTQTDVSVVDDLAAWAAPGSLVDAQTPVVSGFDSAAANTGFDGVGDTETLLPGVVLSPGATGTVELTVDFDIAAGNPASPNTAQITTNRVTVPVTAVASVPPLTATPDVLASKAVLTPEPYQAGQIIDYELTFENLDPSGLIGLTLIDDLPAGMIYVDGSAAPAPDASGQLLRWSGIDLAPGASITITLSAQIIDSAGSFTNTAYVRDSAGTQISNTASATITIAPEPVFDCGDVIGKVFDDRNGNGYQDPPPDMRAQITDQTYYSDGKYDIAPEVIDQQENGEPGLAGVNLVTTRGDIITTDAFGRYSVPCALLPGPTGSNFTLKLDERSLPTGYRVTTENPRTLRLTAGILTEMNFGASLANLVDIDLLSVAFQPNTTTPSAALVRGVEDLVGRIAETPSVLRLTYYTNGEGDDVARARLAQLEALIQDRWRGSYRLRIETTIARVQ